MCSRYLPLLVYFLLTLQWSDGRKTQSKYELCETDFTIYYQKDEGTCSGCDELKNCSTVDGSVDVKGFHHKDDEVFKQLHFPKLREITGHLMVSMLFHHNSLGNIFPSLAVIRGKVSALFLDYSLVVYRNYRLQKLGLNSLTTILNGGVRIEKNINLCYIKTIRWSSIMKTKNTDKYSLVLSPNNNDCYDQCFSGKCFPPAGHGSSGRPYCWGPGRRSMNECQELCDTKCGMSGCLKGTTGSCCHPECLGGCWKRNSPHHCNACLHLRLKNGTCVRKCPPNLNELDNILCTVCPRFSTKEKRIYLVHDGKCIFDCPAGYTKNGSSCTKCQAGRCPRECSNIPAVIDSLSVAAKLEGCTIIKGNFVLSIRSGAGMNAAQGLTQYLGSIEEIHGFVVIRETTSLVSINFFKNLKRIVPKTSWLDGLPVLYNTRYSLAIFENPKLETLWNFHPDLKIDAGGIFIRLNSRLCPKEIYPLVDDVLKWNRTSNFNNRDVHISTTTNGNTMSCEPLHINVSIAEIQPDGVCERACVQLTWANIKINDYRNLMFYTILYRETKNRNITKFDDVYACSGETVWQSVDKKLDQSISKGKKFAEKELNRKDGKENGVDTSSKITEYFNMNVTQKVGNLKPHTSYAFYVNAYVREDRDGAMSDIIFIQTNETIPSAVVGLEASYLLSSQIRVQWKPPLYPNGEIIKYIISYKANEFSYWNQDIDWCDRQLTTASTRDDKPEETEIPENCPVIEYKPCDCEKEKEEMPDENSAIFDQVFEDLIFQTIFTKNDKKDKTPPSTIKPPKSTAPTGCNTAAKGSDCFTTPPPPNQITLPAKTEFSTSTNKPTTNMKSTQTAPPPTPPTYTREVSGKDLSITLTGLKHFTDYAITVCACTNAGCAQVSKGQILSGNCAVTKSRSDKKVDADDLGGPLTYSYNNTNWVVVSWVAPVDPNGKVLKYDLEYRDENKLTSRICVSSDQVKFRIPVTPGLNHTVRVRAITPAGNGSWSNEISFNLVGITKAQIGTSEGIDMKIIIGVSLAAFLIFAFGCGILIFFMSRKSDKNAPGVLYASVNPEYLNSNDVYIADEWEVPRDKIKLIKELGNGSFGMVYEGEATDLVPGQPRCKVAVKTVSENASIKDRIEFLQEASIMKAFNCNHVVRLLGVVSDGQPTLVIMELMESGDLKNFLRSRRPEEENSMPAPLLPEFLQMAAEICDGMAYLADRKFVHRDLAARNCMVSGDYIVKIGDFGMTRDIYETDYYRKGGRGLLPVRWMAPESLRDGVFTTSSDVWSYGVVLWEMATLAAQPYPGMSNEEVLKYVVDGGVMSRPENCPDRLYDLMTLCWQYSNKTRPTFFSILELLENDVSDDFVERSFYLNDYKEQKELRENHHQHRHNSTEKPNRNINNSREHDLDHTPVPDVVEAPVIMRESMA